MAEFKLGRIRFVWKGDWSQGTSYVKDDVVKYGGKTYICQIGHTADSNFYTDLDFVPTKWNQMTDGQEWKGDWSTSEFYSLNDVVKYGGLLYICTVPHTSASTLELGLEADQDLPSQENSKWELFAEGFDWKEDWSVSTRYKVNDLVRYGGYTYVCNEAHTSSSTIELGLEADAAKWDDFNRGLEYQGDWDGNSVRYRINDIVKYGGGLWICVTPHTSTSVFASDQNNWSQFVKGFEFEEEWNSSVVYQPGDIVLYGGNQYVSRTNHSNANPLTSTTNWFLFTRGFRFFSDWSISTSYNIGSVVRVNGYSYLATTDVPANTFIITETNSLNNSFRTTNTQNLIIGAAIRFSGSTFGDVNNGATYYVRSILNSLEFTISDQPDGTVFEPVTDSGSMTATTSPHPTNTQYYQVLNSGVFWRDEWKDDREYEIGDIVRFGTNAYICVQKHRSEEDDGSSIKAGGGGAANSRPDQDTQGLFWSVLSVGSETSVLQVKGDLVYYDTAGPARLPVGKEGQVLRASDDNIPEWITLGGVDFTYYVASTGKDEPAPINGLTWDKPFKTIRYACEQVENGPRNPAAKYLLELNRVFIQKEVTEWIKRQIATNTAPFTNSFVYNDFKCERDTGLIIDAVIYDISHGGNVKTRGAANALVNVLIDSPGTYLKLQDEKDQDIAAWNYMLNVIEDVLEQRPPSVNYQILNGDNSTAIVSQYFNAELEAEPVVPLIKNLVGIILQAIEDGDDANIPERISPTNLINVATGTYREVLPIIVPEQTCVKGAELRSTNAGPREGTTSREDIFYSVSALDKMSEIVSDIVVGNSVSTTFQNNNQSIEFPFADLDEAATLSQLARVIKYNIDFRSGTITTFRYPDPKDYNTAYLQGFKEARTLIEKNKEFLKEEVRAWLNSNFSNLKFSRTKCIRDVGFVVDAIIYDLTYGGNSQSVDAGLSYYEGVGSNLVIDSTEKQATLAAYGFLKNRAVAVASNTNFAPLNTKIARIGGTAGSSAAIALISDNFDDLIEIINNGPEGSYTLVEPNTAWVSSNLTSAASTLAAQITAIQDATIDYINSTFGDFTYDSAKCRRDLGIILEGVYFDVAFGTNFNAVTTGSSYRRAMAIEVIQSQLDQTIGAIRHAKGLAAEALLSNQTAVTRSNAAFDEIIDIIENGVGAADAIVYTDPDVDNNKLYAREQLVTNRDFIRAEIIAWINVNFPSLSYNQTTYSRDIGLIVDALAYDIQYGGNTATRTAALAYFEGAVSVLPADQKEPTAAALDRLKGIVGDIVLELPVAPSSGNSETQDTSGTVASSTEVDELTGLVQIIEDVVAADSLAGLPSKTEPSISWVDAGIQSAITNLENETTNIVKATLQFITDEYNIFKYNHSKCSRDVEFILNAVSFDFMFNANWRSLKSAYSYLRGTAEEVFRLGQKDVTRKALVFVKSLAIQNVNNDPVVINRINILMQAIDDIIYSGSNEGSPCATEQRNRDYAVLQLERNREFIVSEITDWMEYNYVNFDEYYDSAVCSRDVGLIIDAVSYDLITGSNFPSSVAGAAYFRIQSELVTSKQLLQTLAAFRHVKEIAASSVDASLYTIVNEAFDNILNILENGLTVVPSYVFPANGTTDTDGNTTGNTFQNNRSTYQTAIADYLDLNYNSLWISLGAEGQAAYTRDVGYIVDAVTFDIKYGGKYQSVIAGDAYFSFGTLQIAPGEVTAILAAYTELKSLLQADAEASKVSGVGDLLDDIIDIITNGAGTVSTTFPSEAGESATVQNTFTSLQNNKSNIQTSTTQFITDTFSSYTYNVELCERDTNRFIDALKYDLKYPGNYKSLFAARYYSNAVIGSFEEDMYYLRDATGIRDMTLEGLNGDLTPANEYGTSRVSAGAYCSLDPGWGPDDFRTWIIDRSPYVQGVTTFGNACIGQKIDGALHNGGNDSIVSNDFTQVLSNGIGAWVENNGRAELVSVFTYYAHIGYLSTNGGRIRGTNGNNSYGSFGSVAEGFDPTEAPNTAVVDNRFQFDAEVRTVFTNGNQMQIFEFANAGIDYTFATWTLTGGGLGAAAVADEFRDDAVYQVRLLDLEDDSSGQFGGEGYLTNSNTAQGGTTSSITLAATDDELSTAYTGMKVIITAGAGVGQVGIITTYNSGTKVATVIKESDGSSGWDHVVPGTAIASPDASTTYTIEPRLVFDSPGFTAESVSDLPSGAYTDVVFGELTEDYFSVTGNYSGFDAIGALFTVTKKGWKYNIFLEDGGTGYVRLETIVVPGTDLGGISPENDLVITITSVDSVTGEILDFDFDGYGDGGRYVAVRDNTDQGAYSNDGLNWIAMTMPSSGDWVSVTHGILNDFSSFNIEGRFVAVRANSNQAAWSDDGINWNSATLPANTGWKSVTFGNGLFVAISSTTTDVAISSNGINWESEGPLTSTGFVEVTAGRGIFVAIKESSNVVSTSPDAIEWTDRTLPDTLEWNSVAWGNNRFVAIATDSNNGAYSLDGITWSSMTIGSADGSTIGGYQKVRYGQGLFIATAYRTDDQDYSFVVTSEYGIVWEPQGIIAPNNSISGYAAIAFGSPQRKGHWVVLNKDAGTIGARIRTGARTKGRAFVAEEKIFAISIIEPGSGYNSIPGMEIVDPNNLFELPFEVRVGSGCLATPTFTNRGNQYATGSAEVDLGDGYADNYQAGGFVAVRRITQRPIPGSNIVFSNLPGRNFKLVNVITFLGENDGSYTAFFQISPTLSISEAPDHLDDVSTRIRYSQVRLTGHDFLDIGTGGFETSNYPNAPLIPPNPANETVSNNAGRVFFTSTDQDGNFRVGDLFAIEQSTGVATLNADAFNISGLQELNLGNVTLGGGSATITEFSTDPFFTADSDNIVPTQRAIKAFISSQIGGGGASLNVNSVTAGAIVVSSNTITTTTNVAIKMNANFEFRRGVTGAPLAFNYFFK